MEIEQIRRAYASCRLRTPQARQFDRHCLLSATAAQLIVANKLSMEVSAIRVAEDKLFAVGPVANDIVLKNPAADSDTALIAMAGQLGFCLAAGVEFEEQFIQAAKLQKIILLMAFDMILPAIEDGSFAVLVIALDGLRVTGERKFGSGH
jgi:hypothetical protein